MCVPGERESVPPPPAPSPWSTELNEAGYPPGKLLPDPAIGATQDASLAAFVFGVYLPWATQADHPWKLNPLWMYAYGLLLGCPREGGSEATARQEVTNVLVTVAPRSGFPARQRPLLSSQDRVDAVDAR